MTELWTMLSKGGIIMIPLLLTSLVALTVFIERMFYLRRKNIIPSNLLENIHQVKVSQDLQMLLNLIKNEDNAFVNMIRVAVENRDEPDEEIKEAILDQGRREARRLERGLVVLETIAGIAPLLGLLGTVLGMIKVFSVISHEGLGQTQLLSGGISEALITTVAGLSIAIPTLVAYHYFDHKVQDLVLDIEEYSSILLKKLKKMGPIEPETA